jgi:hypothetical protein
MTIDDFHEMIAQWSQKRTGLKAYSDYLQHKTRPDKYLHEEYLAIQAVVVHKGYHGTIEIELGNEKEEWDCRVSRAELFEIVQALPANEHEIRRSLTSGEAKVMLPVDNPEAGEPDRLPVTGPTGVFLLQTQHAHDHFQFPQVIIDAIEKKHSKKYNDVRTLVVVIEGDYSFEHDENALRWIDEIRQRTTRGVFKEVLLVELARRKVFSIF